MFYFTQTVVYEMNSDDANFLLLQKDLMVLSFRQIIL